MTRGLVQWYPFMVDPLGFVLSFAKVKSYECPQQLTEVDAPYT